jgi:hypothetical protein
MMAGMEVPAIFVGRSLFLILGLPRFLVANGRSSPLAADPNSADSLPVQAGMKIGMQPALLKYWFSELRSFH